MAESDRGGERRSIERELKRGSLELIVLHLLEPGEAYGYEIVSKLTAETNGALEVTDGTLYPVLYRLERSGFVSVRWETPERGAPDARGLRVGVQRGVPDARGLRVGVQRGVPRKYYRLTDAGRDELKRLTHEWMTFAKAMADLLRL